MYGLGELAAVRRGWTEGALETEAEIMLVGAPWGASQGQNRPHTDGANADQREKPGDLS